MRVSHSFLHYTVLTLLSEISEAPVDPIQNNVSDGQSLHSRMPNITKAWYKLYGDKYGVSIGRMVTLCSLKGLIVLARTAAD